MLPNYVHYPTNYVHYPTNYVHYPTSPLSLVLGKGKKRGWFCVNIYKYT